MLDVKIVRGSVKGEDFIDFIDSKLLPHLNSFNGTNPNSVIVLDNCSVHHVAGAVQNNRSVHHVAGAVQSMQQKVIAHSVSLAIFS